MLLRAPRRVARVFALIAAVVGGSCNVAEDPRPPGGSAARAPRRPAVAVVAPTPATATPPPPDAAQERAARLGLGTHTAVVHLFVGPAPDAWVREAGGAEPPRVLGWPLERGRWLRGYGEGRGGDRTGRHRGLDIGDEAGAPILAAAEGLVAYAGSELSGYGNVVVVLHPGGWVTLYGHASALIARPGQLVARGDRIARVGHTGNAGGDHVHFELRRDGHKVNPLPFLHGAPARARSTEPLALPRDVRVYRVKRSDRLFRVARGSGMALADLARLNGLGKRDVLLVGHRLLVVRTPRTAEVARNPRARTRHRRPRS